MIAGDAFACIKITGRANFTYGPAFKCLLTCLNKKGCKRIIIDLSECILMDSTFLGVLAGFGLAVNPTKTADKCDIELLNPSTRIHELLENLGVLSLFKITTGTLQLPDGLKATSPETGNPTQEELTRTCLEAHKILMNANPENVARFKEVTEYLAEDLKNLEKH